MPLPRAFVLRLLRLGLGMGRRPLRRRPCGSGPFRWSRPCGSGTFSSPRRLRSSGSRPFRRSWPCGRGVLSLWPCRSWPFRRSRSPGSGMLNPGPCRRSRHPRPCRRNRVWMRHGSRTVLCGRLHSSRRRRNRPHVVIRNHRLGLKKARRPPMIHCGKLSLVGARGAFNLQLRGHWRRMRLMPRHQLSRLRPHPYAPRSAVEADSNVAHNHRMHINVVYHGHIDVVHRAVVEKVSRVPIPALVPHAPVAEPVIHAAIESDVPAPIAAKEHIAIVRIAPVAGSPKRFLVRSLNPRARHPVVARRSIVPVPRCPDITIARIRRLVVLRQCRRRVGSGSRGRLLVARVVIVGILRRRLLIIHSRIGSQSASGRRATAGSIRRRSRSRGSRCRYRSQVSSRRVGRLVLRG